VTIIYRETDPVSGRWTGNSGGIDLSAFQIDQNFYESISRIATLEANETFTVSIDYITINGDQLTFHMTDHSLQGPFKIPIATFTDRGTWAPTTVYFVNDTFHENGTLYLVIFAHTSAGTFSAGANDGMGHNYYSAMLSLPGNSLPTGGAVKMMLTKSDGHDFDVTWSYPVPVGGTIGKYLKKNSSSDFDMTWAYPIPTGGTAGQILTKINATDFNVQWSSSSISMESLSDFIFTSPHSVGQVVQWTGAAWQNAFITIAADIGDVVITSPASGNLLSYSGGNWVNVAQSSLSIAYSQLTGSASPAQLRDPTVTALGTSGTVTLDPTLGDVFTITPSGAAALTAASTPAGARITVIVTTAGTSSFNVTFDIGTFKSQGTLATGVISGKTFTLSFISNGTFFCETSRTAAM